MNESLKTYYRAYRLLKVSEPHLEREWQGIWDSYRGKRNATVHGKCQLELVMENETIEEIVESILPSEIYLQNVEEEKEPIMKPFVLDQMETVDSWRYRLEGGGLYMYVADRSNVFYPKKGFNMIYRSWNGDIIVIMDAWLAENIEEVELSCILEEGKRKEYGRFYEVEFV